MYSGQLEQGAAFTATTQAEREELRADILAERTRADAERDRVEALAARKWWRRS